MKGDGENTGSGGGVRDFLSLGSSSSRSQGSEREGDELVSSSSSLLNLNMLSSHGLSMLAGGSNGGFSLKPPAVGTLANLRNLAMGGGSSKKVTGGGFTGFYRASANTKSSSTTTRPSLLPAGTKLRFASDETEARDEALGAASSSHRGIGIAGTKEQPLKTDVENLTPDECWRLILKLGSRWPAWNGTTSSQASQGVMKERSATKDERVQGGNPHGLQLGQDSLRLLANRALEALAQIPDRRGRPAGGMLAPKWTTQEISKTKAPIPASKSTHPTLATIVKQPSFLAKLPVSSSRQMAAPKVTSSESRTAPLTIFYAGTVNVCDNVPEDKARLIMLFAEKAGINPNVQAPAVKGASPPVTPSPSVLNPPSEILRPQEKLQLSKPSSSEVVLVTGTSSVPSHLAPSAAHAGGSSSDQQPAESSNPAEMAPAEPSQVPVKITITEGKCRQQRQQGTAKPLPNARKNSLARFLDSRKRSRPAGSSSEGQPGKKPALGPAVSDGCPSDGEDMKGSGKSPMNLCSQSSIDSKEVVLASCTDDALIEGEISLVN